MLDPLFRFICRAPQHQRPARFALGAATSPNPITLHVGKWAYCPSGVRDGHEWIAIVPGTLTLLTRHRGYGSDSRSATTSNMDAKLVASRPTHG